MKKLLLTLMGLVFSVGLFAQNGKTETLTSPNTNSPYFLIDTVFTLGTIVEDTTVIYLHYQNPTSQAIQGLQARFFYDSASFGTPIVKWGPVTSTITSKYGAYYTADDWVNFSMVYTASNSTFDWPDGAILKVELPHKNGFDPTSVDSMAIAGATSYSNLATTSGGVDVTLGVHNYGGNFIQPSVTFPVRVLNVGASTITSSAGADSVLVKYEYKLKTNSTYTQASDLFYTDSMGLASVVIPYDSSFYDLKVVLNSSSMGDDGAINVTDAYKIIGHTIFADTVTSYGQQQADVNLSDDITIADGFLVFNRVASSATDWSSFVTGENNVKLLRETEYNTIVGSPSNFSSIDGGYELDSVVNGLDSLRYRVFVLGDATSTGVNNQMLQIAMKTNPGDPSDWVMDMGVLYSTIEDTVEFRVPKLTPALNEVEVPITIYTHGNKIGAAQIGLEFDTNYFQFKGIQTSELLSQWNSFISFEDGRVLWGGHETNMSPAVIEGDQEVIIFKFDVVSTDWTESQIRVFNKGAGSEHADDLNIKPTPTDGTIVYVGKRSDDPKINEMMESFLIYPNPVTNDYVFIDFYSLSDSPFRVEFYNMLGQLQYDEEFETTGLSFYSTWIDMSKVPSGTYIVRMTTPDKSKNTRIIKY